MKAWRVWEGVSYFLGREVGLVGVVGRGLGEGVTLGGCNSISELIRSQLLTWLSRGVASLEKSAAEGALRGDRSIVWPY